MVALAPFFVFACTVSAVKFYGDTPSVNTYTNTKTHLAEPLENNLNLHSVFASSDLAKQNGSDFLADHGILETTLMDLVSQGEGLVTGAMSSGILGARDPADQLNCQKGAVVDKISPRNQKRICNALGALVGGGVGGVAALLDNTVCSEASTGHPVRCHTIVAFTGTAGVVFSSSEINEYCTEYMSANDKKCSSQGIKGDTGNKRASAAVVNTQNDEIKCSGLSGKCTRLSV
jgi:hypothetical protein